MGSSPSHFLLGLLCLLLRIRDYGQWCGEGGLAEGCKMVPLISGKDKNKTKEKRSAVDACKSSPCQNKGTCIQRKFGGHRCDCTGTGFHGQACQIECTKIIAGEGSSPYYPPECVVI